MRHTTKVSVKFGHTDPAGIVHYPRYFEWFHDIFEAAFDPITGTPYASILCDQRVGFPTVQAMIEFRAPARFGETLQVELFLSHLTPRSMTCEYRVRRERSLVATASVKVAAMDLDQHKSTTFPQAIVESFRPYLEEADDEIPDSGRIR